MTRVLITVPCLGLPGGVANYYRTIRPHLDAQKAYFEIGARPGEAGPWAGLRRLLADYWRFHRELRARPVDLVHLNPSLGARSVVRDGILLLIARAHGRRVLVFFRGWDPACERAIRARYARLFRFVYDRADAVVVLAEEFARSLRELGLRAPVTLETTVVADGVFAAAGPGSRDSDRQAGACEILYLSRLDRDKGLIEAIEAVAAISERFPSVTLTVAGDGPERAAAEALVRARRLGNVTFTGHLDEAARSAAFRRADIFLFPTCFGEGMPNAILEAMAFGLPVVTRAVGGIRDFFEDGRMGFVTESRDPAVFAGYLSRLITDPGLRAAMGRYNHDYARNRFAASVVVARLLEIYARVGRQPAAR
ncbi:MAG: glycosyltransferase family 4 protein [Chromatiales bacterium]|nr:glycosyltransferase family 4 protein [Chromatiales bacterium]